MSIAIAEQQIILKFLNNIKKTNKKSLDEINISSKDEKALKLYAIGISNYNILTKAKTPKLYRITGIVIVLMFFLGWFGMFFDLFFTFLNLSNSVYLTWILCCISLYFTNKLALKDWKKHEQKK